MRKLKSATIKVSVSDLLEIALSALNDVEYGNDNDNYVKKIRRIAHKLIDRAKELEK